MGPTIPEDGVNSIDEGTQYERIGASLASSFTLQLLGGKRLYHMHGFTCGNTKNNPANELINIDNYYILELKYIDTNVSVYGPDTSFAIDYYNSGFAFTVADEATAISAIGQYSDIMFSIFSTQTVYFAGVGWRFDGTPGNVADVSLFVEDAEMKITDIIVDHEEHPEPTFEFDVSARPPCAVDGSKLEMYYNDDGSDDVSEAHLEACFYYEPPIVNG